MRNRVLLDRHRGKLGSDCAECHTVQGFTPVEDFDHAARTGVQLIGHHEPEVAHVLEVLSVRRAGRTGPGQQRLDDAPHTRFPQPGKEAIDVRGSCTNKATGGGLDLRRCRST